MRQLIGDINQSGHEDVLAGFARLMMAIDGMADRFRQSPTLGNQRSDLRVSKTKKRLLQPERFLLIWDFNLRVKLLVAFEHHELADVVKQPAQESLVSSAHAQDAT